jgi:hypothetical protein
MGDCMTHTISHTNLKIGEAFTRFPKCMMLESGRIRLVRPSAQDFVWLASRASFDVSREGRAAESNGGRPRSA